MNKLIIVATPIGNLGDISSRCLEALKESDVVYCEDTRVTKKLLNAFSIKKPLKRMDENSISEKVSELIEECASGKNVCYCTDAGMPGISDPGSRIVEACRNAGVDVEVLPGANACLIALVSSGFKIDHFFFEGFLPKKKTQKQKRLEFLLNLDCPFVIYESPKRVLDTLECLSTLSLNRKVCVAKELTKLHEEITILPAKEMCEAYKTKTLKGEFVIVVDRASDEENKIESDKNLLRAKEFAKRQIERGAKLSDVRSDLVEFFNCSKNEAYEICINKSKF